MKRFTLAAFCLALFGISAVVTNAQTTFNNTTAITIPAGPANGTPYPSTINVTGLSGNVTDVNVRINGLTHTFPDDIDILLVSPNGTAVILQGDAGGAVGLNNVTYTFDQAATAAIPDSAAITNNATYDPANYVGNDGATDAFPAPAPQTGILNPGPQTGGTAGNLDAFNGGVANGTWSLYVRDDEAGDMGSITGGWSIIITAGTPTGGCGTSTRRIEFDFDADCRTDFAVVRGNAGVFNWYILRSSDNTVQFQAWGATGDTLAPGDFNGDRRFDFNVWRTGTYFLQLNGGASSTIRWGTTGDGAGGRREGDYDGDGSDDPTVTRNVSGALVWYVRQSSNGQTLAVTWGAAGDQALPAADWDGDGRDDIAVYRQIAGAPDQYVIRQSTNGTSRTIPFGEFATDVILADDFDGDGRADAAIWRAFAATTAPDYGLWYILQSSNNQVTTARFGIGGTVSGGTATFSDLPTPGDYDGDGRYDISVFRPSTGVYYVLQSTNGTAIGRQFGASTDLPLQFLRTR